MREDYLLDVTLSRIPALEAEVLVIGSGVAGCSAAIAAAEAGAASVVVLAKDAADFTATDHAQGGVAAALGPDDSIERHLADTLAAGAGLCEEAAVRKLVADGPGRVRQLISWGAVFDRENGDLARTAEAAHSVRRVLHASGDATGREIQRALLSKLLSLEAVTVVPSHFAVDLLHCDHECFGALALDSRNGTLLRVSARATVLATGGLGQVYRETTNPAVATGDGLAMALRAGAHLSDMEFVQFHPTTLYLAGAPRFLISEAVRGEGAVLLNSRRQRFMPRYHELAELAPRDVVSRSIVQELAETGGNCVYLDLTGLAAELVNRRFPNIREICADFGLNILSDPIPVRPSAHYAMGGVRTDLDGRTDIRRLCAAGECASTGVHGANRLASNSLLEGLVFGAAAGEAARVDAATPDSARKFPSRSTSSGTAQRRVHIDVGDLQRSLKSLMWRTSGVFRTGSDLELAVRQLAFWREYACREEFHSPAGLELQNMLAVAGAIARSALARTESRGAHQRLDCPSADDGNWKRHTVINKGEVYR